MNYIQLLTVKHFKRIALFFMGTMICFPGIAISEPIICGASGVVEHGQTVEISGTGFGSKPQAAPERWDTADNQPDYDSISDGYIFENNNDVGPWPATFKEPEYRTYESRSQRHQFSTASYFGDESGGTVGGFEVQNDTNLYFTWWWNPSTDVQPPDLGASNKFCRYGSVNNMGGLLGSWRPNQHKIANYFCDEYHSPWLWDSSTTYKVDDVVGWHDAEGNCEVYRATAENTNKEPPDATYWTFCGENWDVGANDWSDWGGTYGEWNRLEVYFDNDTMTGYVKTNGQIVNEINWYNEELHKGDYPKITWLNMVGLDTNKSVEGLAMDFDDIYVDSTQARVELGDNSNYGSCTHLEIQPATYWSNDAISVDLNQGSFQKGEEVYLFVIDSEGNASQGVSVIIGEGAATALLSPLPPENLIVTD